MPAEVNFKELQQTPQNMSWSEGLKVWRWGIPNSIPIPMDWHWATLCVSSKWKNNFGHNLISPCWSYNPLYTITSHVSHFSYNYIWVWYPHSRWASGISLFEHSSFIQIQMPIATSSQILRNGWAPSQRSLVNDWFMGWRASEDLNLFFSCYFLGETKKLCDQSRRANMGLKLGHWIAIHSDFEVYFDGFRWIAAVYPSICLKQSRKHQGQKALLFCNSNLTHFAAVMAALRRMVFTPTTGPGAGHVVRCSV